MKKNLFVDEICLNEGQIDGLPKNPRFIKGNNFEKLKKSISDNPEMLDLRPLMVYPFEGKFIVIGGNMRFRACKDLGYKELPCEVLNEDTPVENLRAYMLKDNGAFGEWDFDLLANEFDTEELEAICLHIPEVNVESEIKEEEIVSTFKVEVTCQDEQEQEQIYNEFMGRGMECKLLTF